MIFVLESLEGYIGAFTTLDLAMAVAKDTDLANWEQSEEHGFRKWNHCTNEMGITETELHGEFKA